MRTIFLILILSLPVLFVNAQKFWLTTDEFPGGLKTNITGIKDTFLFVGTGNTVLRSGNEGNHWDEVLKAHFVFSVYATDNGVVLVGGFGKIYNSVDYGNTWDSVSLAGDNVIAEFVVNKSTDELYAITQGADTAGYKGAGVYYSGNNGQAWEQRINGLGGFKFCDHITIDRNGRLYLAMFDENVTGNAGLFISDNKGLLWEHMTVTIDGRGVIDGNISVGQATGLSISPGDSLFMSITGTAVNVGVRLNLSKSIADIRSNKLWNPFGVINNPSWWDTRIINDIHFAENGDLYSSSYGSTITGGTYFRKANDWNQQREGLGVDINGLLSVQSFYEKSSGRIFMVQYADERVYVTDTSRLISTTIKTLSQSKLSVYPNPVQADGKIYYTVKDMGAIYTLRVIDSKGACIFHRNINSPVDELQIPGVPGLYLLQISNERETYGAKIIVE